MKYWIWVLFLFLSFARANSFLGATVDLAGERRLVGTPMMAAVRAFQKTCSFLAYKSPARFMGTRYVSLYVGDFRPSCKAVWKVTTEVGAEDFFLTYFKARRIPGRGVFTGYYRITIPGSLFKTSLYPFPVYMFPNNTERLLRCSLSSRQLLHHILACYSRRDIQRGKVLGDKNLEVIFLRDLFDLYMLQLQGSGIIQLPTGERLALRYDGNNGRSFSSLAAYLRDKEHFALADLNNRHIRSWMMHQPDRGESLLEKNPRYIFFHVTEKVLQPAGAFGVELTPLGSLAVDHHYYPYGLPIFLSLPKANKHLRKLLLVTQDTGAAIKGRVRGDIFWGTGERAGIRASNTRWRGHAFLLIPKYSLRASGHERKREYRKVKKKVFMAAFRPPKRVAIQRMLASFYWCPTCHVELHHVKELPTF